MLDRSSWPDKMSGRTGGPTNIFGRNERLEQILCRTSRTDKVLSKNYKPDKNLTKLADLNNFLIFSTKSNFFSISSENSLSVVWCVCKPQQAPVFQTRTVPWATQLSKSAHITWGDNVPDDHHCWPSEHVQGTARTMSARTSITVSQYHVRILSRRCQDH